MKLFKKMLSVLVSLVLAGSLFAPALAAAYKTGGAGSGQKVGQKGGWESFRWQEALGRRAGCSAGAEGRGEASAPKDGGKAAAPAEGDADKGTAAQAVQYGAWRVRRGGVTTGIRGLAYSGGGGSASADGTDGGTAKRTGGGEAAASGTGTLTPDSVPSTRAAVASGSAFRGFPVLPLSVRREEAARSVCALYGFEEGFPGGWFVTANGTAAAMDTGGAGLRAFADGIRTPAFPQSGQAAERASGADTRRGVPAAPNGKDSAAHRLFYIWGYEGYPTGRGDAFRLGCRALAVEADGDGRCRVRGGWNVCGKWIDFGGDGARASAGGADGTAGQDWRDGVPAEVPARFSWRAAPALPNRDSAPTAGEPSAVPMADAADTGDCPQGWGIAALLSGLGAAHLGRRKKGETG